MKHPTIPGLIAVFCVLVFMVGYSAVEYERRPAPGDGLWARLIEPGGDIAVHDFSAAIHLWAIGDVTQTQVVNAFSLTGDDLTDGAALKAIFDDATTASSKNILAARLHWWLILGESQYITCAQFNTALGTSWGCPE